MANDVNLKISSIVQKHDIEANWNKATNFIPAKGQIIVYDIEIDIEGKTLELPSGRTEPITYERFKIGDGIKTVINLPFSSIELDNYYTKNEIDNLTLITAKDIDIICGVITLISFKVGSSSYQAEEGMTFSEWVNSEYNTNNYYISGNYVCVNSSSRISSVSPSTMIIADRTYSTT